MQSGTSYSLSALALATLATLALATGCDSGDESQALGELDASYASGEAVVGSWPAAPLTHEAQGAASAAADLQDLQAPQAGPAVATEGKHSPKAKHVPGWLRWALGQPNGTGPIADQTGDACAQDQDGPVWYLAGTFGGPVTRECDIPLGKQLFFPLVNRWVVFPPEFYADQAEIDETIPMITDWFDQSLADTCGLTLRIDGVDVMDLDDMKDDLYVRVDDPFEIDLNEDHWAAQWFAGGTMQTVGDGHYARIQPMTPGDHVVEFGGTICGESFFETSATYILHVGNSPS